MTDDNTYITTVTYIPQYLQPAYKSRRVTHK